MFFSFRKGKENCFFLFLRNKNFSPFMEEGEMNYSIFRTRNLVPFSKKREEKCPFRLLSVRRNSFHSLRKKNLFMSLRMKEKIISSLSWMSRTTWVLSLRNQKPFHFSRNLNLRIFWSCVQICFAYCTLNSVLHINF